LNKNKIIEVIKKCFDPEIPVDLWNLGLIYNIEYKSLNQNYYEVNILMTLTTPGCGMADHIANDLKNKLLTLVNVSNVNIKTTFEPPWQPEMMSNKAKEILGLNTNKENNNWE
jgi:metal-sulfur cluster biosynthetic enzyme